MEEGIKLRERGFFAEARQHFAAALQERPQDLEAAILMAAMSMQQGLLGDCHEFVTKAHAIVGMDGHDPAQLAVLDMMAVFSSAVTSAKFAKALGDAAAIFHNVCGCRAVEEFDSRLVIVVALYHQLVNLAHRLGFLPADAPTVVSVEFQRSLADHLLSSERYSDAAKIAKLGGHLDMSSDNSRLVERLLSTAHLPELTRADLLMAHASTLLRLSDDRDKVRRLLQEAQHIYESQGHAFGALEARLGLMRLDLQNSDPDQAEAETWAIKDHMQRLENWAGVKDCLIAIWDIHHTRGLAVSGHLMERWEAEWQAVRETTHNKVDWAIFNGIRIGQWLADGSAFGRALATAEDYLEQISALDMPALIGSAFRQLRRVYLQIGETTEADRLWSRYRPILPRSTIFLEGLDAFGAALNVSDAGAGPDGAIDSLVQELDRVQRAIQETADLEARNMLVLRLFDVAREYIAQYDLRGPSQTALLVGTVCTAIEAAVPLLRAEDRKKHLAKILQIQALLLSHQADRATDTVETDRMTTECLQIETEALSVYRREGYHLLAGTASSQVGLRLQKLWQLRGCPPESDDFEGAAEALLEAWETMQQYGTVEAQLLVCQSLVELWFTAMAKHQQVRLRSEWVAPRQRAMEWVGEGDRLGSVQRNDLSALGRLGEGRLQAVRAKQFLACQGMSQYFCVKGIALCGGIADVRGVWDWLQKSKARSISDTLALGIRRPPALQAVLESDNRLRAMDDDEANLAAKVNAVAPEERLLARLRLESHRELMKEHAVFRAVFELREGQPTTVERLQEIGTEAFDSTGKRLFFVDWMQLPGLPNFFMIVASHLGLAFFKLDYTTDQAHAWKEQGFFAPEAAPEASAVGCVSQTQRSGPADTALEPLKHLKPLVQPLLGLANPGDILVFCPTGELHGIPLHAAIVADDSALIESFPIVYTASMTALSHCVTREFSRSRHGSPLSRAYAAVFERTETSELGADSLETRAMVYEQMQDLEFQKPNARAFCGTEFTPPCFKQMLQEDYICFLGHAGGGTPGDVLRMGLFLSAPPGEEEGASTLFTVTDMFGLDITTSLFVLMACQSVEEAHGPGDEPLGIASALLCAGANTVVGTMWKIQVPKALKALSGLERYLSQDNNRTLLDVATVVQETVKWMKRDSGQHPYDWASVVIHGSWFSSR